MKKKIISTFGLIILTSVAGMSVLAEDATTTATVTLEANSGTGGDGNTTDPGGEGEVTPPAPGEDGDGGVVNPGQTTPLKLGLLTAFNFGHIQMDGNTKSYSALLPEVMIDGTLKERPNFIQVSDHRGTNTGWHVTAQLSQQFTNGESTLSGSDITLTNGWASPQSEDMLEYQPTVVQGAVITEEDATLIANATTENGMGTWSVLYGSLDGTKGNASSSVFLTIPGKVKKTTGSYQAKVLWTLNDTPEN